MPKYNLDEGMFEPVEFSISGKKYELIEVSHKEFEEISDLDSIAEQFSRFTGTLVKDAEKISYRKLAGAISLILAVVTQGAKDMPDLVKKKESDPTQKS